MDRLFKLAKNNVEKADEGQRDISANTWTERAMGSKKSKIGYRKKEVVVEIGYQDGENWEAEGQQIGKIYDHAPMRKWRHLDSCQF